MLARTLRGTLIVLAGFLSLSAVPGGVMLLAGIYAPPVEQLAGSIFPSLLIPGLSLLLIVGGSAVMALTFLIRRHAAAVLLAALAGVILMTFEFVEVLAIGSPPGPARVMQLLYFGVGLALASVALAAIFVDGRRSDRR